MRFIRFVFLAFVGLAFFILALANREPVTLRLLPEPPGADIAGLPAISLPLFMPIFGGVILGLLIGFFWEWIREHHHRARASAHQRTMTRMQEEIATLRQSTADPDDVLALIND